MHDGSSVLRFRKTIEISVVEVIFPNSETQDDPRVEDNATVVRVRSLARPESQYPQVFFFL